MGPSRLRVIPPRPLDDVDTGITTEDTDSQRSQHRKTQSPPEGNNPLASGHSHYDAPDEYNDTESVDTVIYDGDSTQERSLAGASVNRRRRGISDDSDDEDDGDHDLAEPSSEKPVTWRSLPKKGQLAILTFARLSEPLAQTSLQAYLFYQLRSFDPSLPDSTISAQAGVLQGSFTAAQFVTAVWWGRLADTEWMGRKRVLIIGLLGTCISSLGFGFSRSFASAVVFRILGGILNSNVGVMRTMIAEIIHEKNACNSMTFVFLPAPRAPEGSRDGLFHFGGGLGLPSSRVGLATAIIGFIGLPLQIFIYPRVQSRLGTLTSFRTFLPFSPLAYALMPFIVLIPRYPWLVWPAFTVVVGLQVVSRTFALPAAIILVNNSVTDPRVLGTVHGVAQSIASGARTLGPLIGGWGLGLGLKYNMVGGIWWALAVEAIVGWFLLWSIYEDNGIEQKKDQTEEEDT
ncbi:hypothetical protein APSETT444_000934 [Aspergillus pseudonomiae]